MVQSTAACCKRGSDLPVLSMLTLCGLVVDTSTVIVIATSLTVLGLLALMMCAVNVSVYGWKCCFDLKERMKTVGINKI